MQTLADHCSYVWRNGLNELRHRYAGSGVGVFWNVVNPLFQILIYGGLATVLFPRPAHRGANVLWLCAGLLVWLSFSEGLVRGSQSVVRLAAHIRTSSRPIPIFVAQGALASLLGLLVALLLLQIAGFLVTGTAHPTSLLGIVPAALLLHTMAFGMGLALASLRALLPDVSEILRSLLQVWMWSIPVVYEASRLPEAWQALLPVNPPFVYVDSLRRLILGAGVGPAEWGWMAGWAAFWVAVGLAVARGLESDVRDVL